MLLLTHLNFGEIIGRVSSVHLKLLKHTLIAPKSTAGIERIFSVAGSILSDRRTRTSDDIFENQLFAKVNLELSVNYEKH